MDIDCPLISKKGNCLAASKRCALVLPAACSAAKSAYKLGQKRTDDMWRTPSRWIQVNTSDIEK